MSDIAISVQNLSKLYTIGAAQQRHNTTSAVLSASLVNALPRIARKKESEFMKIREIRGQSLFTG